MSLRRCTQNGFQIAPISLISSTDILEKILPLVARPPGTRGGFSQGREIPKDFTMSQLQPTGYKGGFFSRKSVDVIYRIPQIMCQWTERSSVPTKVPKISQNLPENAQNFANIPNETCPTTCNGSSFAPTLGSGHSLKQNPA